MHPEHPDPEAEILWMGQPGIKGIKLHSHGPSYRKAWHQADARWFDNLIGSLIFTFPVDASLFRNVLS
jgi:hypothetical protein